VGYHNSRQEKLKSFIKNIPLIGSIVTRLRRITKKKSVPIDFSNSGEYWEKRYSSGDNSGAGSYSKLAEFKAEVVNEFVSENNVLSVIDFGCGDGNQLILSEYPKYVGFDVSETAVVLCRKKFRSDNTKQFRMLSEYSGETAELTLSMDIIFHLVEDPVFEAHMTMLFEASTRYVIIYSSNRKYDSISEGDHVRHRKFTEWIDRNAENWKLLQHIPNRFPYEGDDRSGSYSDIFVYEKSAGE